MIVLVRCAQYVPLFGPAIGGALDGVTTNPRALDDDPSIFSLKIDWVHSSRFAISFAHIEISASLYPFVALTFLWQNVCTATWRLRVVVP